MGCTIRFTPLLGTGHDQPVCGLLEIDGVTLLMNCGWNEQFDEQLLEPVISKLPLVDAVLLTHSDLSHLGALPYLVGRHGLSARVFSTVPVRRMGHLAMQELLLDKRACCEFGVFSADDVTAAFDPSRWTTLRFYQKFTLELPDKDGAGGVAVTITPYNAGHLLGGCVWRIVAGYADGRGGGLAGSNSEEEVVYAVDWCHKKERHLASCVLVDLFCSRPALMVTDAMDALAPTVDATGRDIEFLDVIMATLRGSDGSVLIPCDASGRVLEVALLLDAFWAREKLDRIYPLVMLSDVSKAVAEAAQSQLEFMSDSVGKAFEMRRDNPFNFRCIRLLSSLDQLAHLQAGPKVVLAPHPSLEHGPARDILLQWVRQPRNTLCFVQRPPAGSLGDTLVRHTGAWPLALPVQHSKRVPLEGAELEEWERGRAIEGEGEDKEGLPAEHAEAQSASPTGAPQVPEQTTKQAGKAGGRDSLELRLGVPEGGWGGRQKGRGHGVHGTKSGPLRTNSERISTLVKDAATGVMVQVLGEQQQGDGPRGEQGLVLESTLMDGFVGPQGAAHPAFPDEDDEGPLAETWDDYGVCVDHEAFKQALQRHHHLPGMAGVRGRGKVEKRKKRPTAHRGGGGGGWRGWGPAVKGRMELEEEEAAEEEEGTRGGLGEDMEMEGASDEEQDDRPTKIVTETINLVVQAAVRYFNFDGRADSRIVRKVLADIAPRSLVILRGPEAARDDLCAKTAKELEGLASRVTAPEAGEMVDASTPAAYMLYVSDAVHARAASHKLGGSGFAVSLVDAVLGPPAQYHPTLLQLLPVPPPSQQPTGDEALDPAVRQAEREPWLGDIFLVDGADGVKLSGVKKALADAGIQSTWRGPGALSCGGVVISKVQEKQQGKGGVAGMGSSKGHLVLEAAVSEHCDTLLQRVRAVIYKQYSACT